MVSLVLSPSLGSSPLGGSLRHLGQISKGQRFPRLEFCLSALLIPWFSAPWGSPGLNAPLLKEASSAAAPSSQHLLVNFGAEMICSHWQDQQPPAFLSSVFCLFKIKCITASEGRRGVSQLHKGKGRPGTHLCYGSSESPGLVGSPLVALLLLCLLPQQTLKENRLAVSTLPSLRPLQVKLPATSAGIFRRGFCIIWDSSVIFQKYINWAGCLPFM